MKAIVVGCVNGVVRGEEAHEVGWEVVAIDESEEASRDSATTGPAASSSVTAWT